MKAFIAHFTVKDGRIEWRNKDYVGFNIPKYEGLHGVLTIKTKWNKRSLNQNRYFWLCLSIIAEYTGHTPEELHVIYKGLYCPKKEVTLNEKTYMIPKGTSELSKGEFVDLILNVSVQAAEMGIVLPDPSDNLPELLTQ